MMFRRSNLRWAALLSIGSLFVLAPAAFGQNPPQPAPQTPPGQRMQGVRPPAPSMRGPRVVMRRPGMMRREGLLRLLRDPNVQKQLNITEEQHKKLEDIVFNSEKAAIQDNATLRLRRLELRHLMQADNPDRAAIDKKIQEISQVEAGLMKIRTNGLLDARAVLTKEQRDKIREIVQRRPQPMGQGMNRPWMMRRGINRPGQG